MGVQVMAITPQIARQLGVPQDTTGVVVAAIDPGSDAAQKSLARSTIISSAKGRAVATHAELEAQVRAAQSEGREAILVRISRRGEPERTVPVRLRRGN